MECGVPRSHFFFNDTAPTEIYTLSLHDALPIFLVAWLSTVASAAPLQPQRVTCQEDRKSTRLNSSHLVISYAVFCWKKKSYYPAFWAIPTMMLSESAAAATFGLINSIGQLGGLAGPYVIGCLNVRTHSLAASFGFIALVYM